MYPTHIDTFLKATSRDIGRQLRFKEAHELQGIREAERTATFRRAAMYSQPAGFFATVREQAQAEKMPTLSVASKKSMISTSSLPKLSSASIRSWPGPWAPER